VHERVNVAAYLLWMTVLAIVLLRAAGQAPGRTVPDAAGGRHRIDGPSAVAEPGVFVSQGHVTDRARPEALRRYSMGSSSKVPQDQQL